MINELLLYKDSGMNHFLMQGNNLFLNQVSKGPILNLQTPDYNTATISLINTVKN